LKVNQNIDPAIFLMAMLNLFFRRLESGSLTLWRKLFNLKNKLDYIVEFVGCKD